MRSRAAYIKKIVRAEEENFGRTVDKGFELLNSLIDRLEEKGLEKGGILSGEDAFRLYDTFGFPLDLTKEIIAEKNLAVDEAAFRQLMDEQRRRPERPEPLPTTLPGARMPLLR